MGISGLLPLLKSIQTNKHLSEFSGQRLAVDAYVWLHRGVYACAIEVATGKKTTKYVDYAMTRVRLLRHYKIEPYIVFDGGPLPAKRGTESDRKRKRDDNLAEANRLAAQGKHSQAREYYVKCVDVTPEMAYQFIKALRAECVPYVVAPYEADAQLAYLERTGIVNGIITEDSDLLVFGCRNVLFKLDTVASTVMFISRSDFGSVTASEGGISLIGWNDTDFRTMAILSGCDYLPSIPGIGLKTAWSLLRKHKTAEKVVRAVRLEGKKEIPKDYLQSMKLVEKVFLHQRVYDPKTERLVHLTEIPDGEELDGLEDAYVGEDLEPSIAKKLALGDVCPITLLPMTDIHPGFVPRALKALPFALNGPDQNQKNADVEKAKAKSILSFFGPAKTAPAHTAQSRNSRIDATTAGKASGKRRLSDMADAEVFIPKPNRDENDRPKKRPSITRSRFFSGSPTRMDETNAIAGPSRPSPTPIHEESTLPEPDDVDLDLDIDEIDRVVQEDGYLSPTASFSRLETPDLSSPLRPSKAPATNCHDDDFDADILSSPVAPKARPRPRDKPLRRKTLNRKPVNQDVDCVNIDTESEDDGPDLRGTFAKELTSEINCPEPENSFNSSTSSSSGPFTPVDAGKGQLNTIAAVRGEETDDGEEEPLHEVRKNNVANGWLQKWAYSGEKPTRTPLRRAETTTTSEGLRRPRTSQKPIISQRAGVTPRLIESLVLNNAERTPRKQEVVLDEISDGEGPASTSQDRLKVFRFRGR